MNRIGLYLSTWLSFSNLLILTFVLYFTKNYLWPLTYLFVLFYLSLLVNYFFIIKEKITLKVVLLNLWPALVLLLIYLVAFLFGGEYHILELQKSIFRLILLFSLFYFAFKLPDLNKKNKPYHSILKLVVYFAIFFSILNLIKFVFIDKIPNGLFEFLRLEKENPTIAGDRNFFALYLIFALVIINYQNLFNNKPTLISNLVIYVFNSLLIINIIISSSIRGIFVFIILGLIFVIRKIFYIFKNHSRINLVKRIVIFCAGFLFLLSLSNIVIKNAPKVKFTFIVNRYATLFGVDNLLKERMLWEKQLDVIPNGNRIIDSTVFINFPEYWSSPASVNGDLVIVSTPYGKGFKIKTLYDINSNHLLKYEGPQIMYYANQTYEISFKSKVLKGDSHISVGWRDVPDWEISEGRGFYSLPIKEKKLYNGWKEYTAYYTFNDNHIGITGFLFSDKTDTEIIIADFKLVNKDYLSDLPKYAFELKYTRDLLDWMNKKNPPLINDENLINNGDFSLGLKYWNRNANETSIHIDTIDDRRCARIVRGKGDGAYWSLLYYGRSILFKANNEYQLDFLVKPVKPRNDLPFKVGFYVNEGNGYMHNLTKEIDTLKDGWLRVKVQYRFINDNRNIGFLINSQRSNTEFYISNVKLKNLTENQKLKYDLIDSKKGKTAFYSSRTKRWLYAKELWDREYKWYHKLFGHGFDYLKWYGEKFFPNQSRIDYPHNPFISVVLYSGIVGLILYILLIIKVIVLYLKYKKEYRVVFIGFLLTFFFTFFSGDNPFDPPIMGFFMLLPFLMDFAHKMNNEPKSILPDE